MLFVLVSLGYLIFTIYKMHEMVNVDNSSASFFRCSPLKITEITLAFGAIVNKNVCKTFVGTKIHENV